MLYTGIDFHKRYSVACTMDAAGERVKETRIANTLETFASYFRGLTDKSGWRWRRAGTGVCCTICSVRRKVWHRWCWQIRARRGLSPTRKLRQTRSMPTRWARSCADGWCLTLMQRAQRRDRRRTSFDSAPFECNRGCNCVTGSICCWVDNIA